MPPDPSRVRKQLANELAALRRATGLSMRTFADQALHTTNHARVQRAEQASASLPAEADVLAWLGFAAPDDGARDRVLALFEAARDESLPYPELMASAPEGHLQGVAAEDERAPINLAYQAIMVPGLAQTAAYARALVPHLTVQPPSIEAHLAGLLHRQEVLHQAGRQFRWLLTRTAATWNPDPDAVSMSGQLDRLRELDRLPTVDIRVLADDIAGPRRAWSSFTVYDGLDDREPHVVLELEHDRDRITRPPAVTLYRQRFEQLWTAAAPVSAVLDVLRT